MRTLLIILSLLFFTLFTPIHGITKDYYVNSVTGSDSLSCGQLPDTPCKSVKRTMETFTTGDGIIKISHGSYVEDDMHFPSTTTTTSNITIEGGWNSNFTEHSCDQDTTVIIAGDRTGGWNAIFHAWVGTTETAAYTIRCMTLKKTASGTLTEAVSMVANVQGQLDFTLEHVRVTGFLNDTIALQARDNSKITTQIDQSTLDRNAQSDTGSALVVSSVDTSSLTLDMQNSRLQHNGSVNNSNSALNLKCRGLGTLDATVKNCIITENSSKYSAPGINLYTINPGSKSHLVLTNNTVSNNINGQNPDNAGITVYCGDSSVADVSMTNTILSGNHLLDEDKDLFLRQTTSGQITFIADYNIINAYGSEGTPTYTSTHELNVDPQLDSTYHLLTGSPAIDAGQCGYDLLDIYKRVAPFNDIDGDKRPGSGKLLGCDIGADEFMRLFPWPIFLPAIFSPTSSQ